MFVRFDRIQKTFQSPNGEIPALLDEELPQQAITTAFRKFAK